MKALTKRRVSDSRYAVDAKLVIICMKGTAEGRLAVNAHDIVVNQKLNSLQVIGHGNHHGELRVEPPLGPMKSKA